MKSIISHFYNEEYLLPWWLEYHKKYFDYGLMIDYNSTDNSVEIIKDICPDWQIVQSINSAFNAKEVDEEVMYYEEQIPGWKISLNTTEFLIGNYKLLQDIEEEKKYYIPCFYFVDDKDNSYPNQGIPLYEQLFYGVDYEEYPDLRKLRCLHNTIEKYNVGRHYMNYQDTSKDFIIFNYGYAPMNEYFISRKLQIQNKIPLSDKIRGFGVEHHNYGKGLTEKDVYDKLNELREISKNLYDKMKVFLDLTNE
jgi:hypothetical protein